MRGKKQKKHGTFPSKALILAFCICIISGYFSLPVRAEEDASILQSILTEDGIDLYVGGLGEYSDVTAQIGREPVEVVQAGQDIDIHTIILLDNSLSVTKDNMAKAKETLKKYVEIKKESEKVSIAVYGTDIQYLTEKETDKDKIVEAVESIASEDKDTYLTDVLYDELVKLGNKTEYTRFIVITDGVDNKEIGYTKEELSAYLKDSPYPVYTVGCKYKSNEDELKNLFAISRLTNAKYYLLDDYENLDEIAEGFCEPVTGIKVKVPEELRDGSVRNILLSFQGEDGTVEVTDELSMPFGLRAEGVKPEEIPEPEEPEPAEEPMPVEEPEQTEKSKSEAPVPKEATEEGDTGEQEGEQPLDLVSIVAIGVIGIALIFLLLMNRKKKGKSEGKDKKKNRSEKEIKKVVNEEDESEENKNSTVIISPENKDSTVFLDGKSRAGYIVSLKYCEDVDRVFRYPLADKVVIGRVDEEGVDIVLNDKTVSAKHCEITARRGHFYIKDLKSSNGTYLDGNKMPSNETWEFSSGSIVQMGNLKIIVEVEQINR